MELEDGAFLLRGCRTDDPGRIRTVAQLIDYIDVVGFLPLFAGDIPGFSVEEHVDSEAWFCGDERADPWQWRETIARSGKAAYGKFFAQKSGFVSLKWFPVFANARRDGYDFDARYEDELASFRQKKIMDQFIGRSEWMGSELKRAAGFGKGGEKNFPGTVSALQMETYLVVKDFRQKINRRGGTYGMPVCVYATPEDIWGDAYVKEGYREAPKTSGKKIRQQCAACFPKGSDRQWEKLGL